MLTIREIEGIDRICELLKEKWKKVPDQRLGQFLINYIFGPHPHHPGYDSYIFFKEDDGTEEQLRLLWCKIMDINSKLRKVVDKIATEIKRVHKGKIDISYSDIMNYMLGHGDLAFNLRDEKSLRRGELIGDLSEEESRKIIEWCYQKMGNFENYKKM